MKNYCFIKIFVVFLLFILMGMADAANPLRINHPPSMNGDQIFSGVKNQRTRFILAGASDVDKDVLTYSLSSSPTSGSLLNCVNGTSSLSCEFIPPPEFRGVTEFSYKANDGFVDSTNISKVILRYDLNNTAPIVGANQELSTKLNTSLDFNLSSGKDVDGDELKYILVSSNAKGALQGCLNGTASKRCTYTPSQELSEIVTLNYKVNDGLSDSFTSATVIIRVGAVNHAPTMNGDQIIYYEPGKQVQFVLAGASDVDFNSLIYTLVSPSSLDGLSGCLDGSPHIKCTFSPSETISGDFTIFYRANDGIENSANLAKIIFKQKGEILDIDYGYSHTCVLLDSGSVKCWGNNNAGQLGYGNTTNIGDAKDITNLQDVSLGEKAIQISLGGERSCALLASGNVKCWGQNIFAGLGYGDMNVRGDDEIPSSYGAIPIGEKVKQIAVGEYHTCALTVSNKVKCWGWAYYGQLGYGNSNSIGGYDTPDMHGYVELGEEAVSISSGHLSMCAILKSGTSRCWGANMYGQLGNGANEIIGDDEIPTSIAPINFGVSIKKITPAYMHTCALLENGSVWCWGLNDRGQLGVGNTFDINSYLNATQVVLPGIAKDLRSKGMANCAVMNDDKVYCWGGSDLNQLGYGNLNHVGDNELPESVGPVGTGNNLLLLAPGDDHSCAAYKGKKIKCWGRNTLGQLGYGNTEDFSLNMKPTDLLFLQLP